VTLDTAGDRGKVSVLRVLLAASLTVAVSVVPALAEPGPRGLPQQIDSQTQVATRTPGNAVVIPEVLSAEDATRYEKIFALQEKARWGPADREIKKLQNPVLMGHVQAQRFLHPCCYRSKYHELRDWLAKYADHPQATRIHKLALKRRPKGAGYPRRPIIASNYVASTSFAAESDAIPMPRLSSKDRKNARYLRAVFSRNVRRERLTAASKILERNDAERLFGRVGYDEARARLAAGYYRYGRDDEAFRYAAAAAKRSGSYFPLANWTAGLAAWRLGRFADAAAHFEALAVAEGVSDWNVAAAAYWAARAHLVGRNPVQVNRWLETAAQYPRTFYGLLAVSGLGLDKPFDWSLPETDLDHMAQLVASPYAERALALLQVGQHALAERELANVRHVDDDGVADALLALADAADLPRLSFRIGSSIERRNGRSLVGALYPVPSWEPSEGFIVDRALIFAVMRQESQFNIKAKSRSGARGLMQLMPATASFIGRDRSLHRRARNKLYEPELNISLGQRYLKHLLENEVVQGNLFLAAAAYNAGPGNLAKWQQRIDYRDDALLFIESIPSRETRVYIERVFTNLWIYRMRLGQPTPTLDAIAAGKWPVYVPLDNGVDRIVANEHE